MPVAAGGALIRTVPFLLALVVVERWSLKHDLGTHARTARARACWVANGLSYSMLSLFWITMLVV